MKYVAILFLSCLSMFAQSPLITGSGIDWTSGTSSGGSDYNYAGISGLYLQLFANNSTNWTGSTSGSTPAVWLDNSGNQSNFTNYSTFPTPKYTSAGPNGFYCLDFSANANNASSTIMACKFDLETNQASTIIIVATEVSDTTANGNSIFDCATGSRNYLRTGTAHAGMYAGTSVALPNFGNTSNWFIFSTVYNGINTVLRTNGTTCKILSIGGNALGQMMLGQDPTEATAYFGKITAVLAWNRALLTNELGAVEYELNLKYNLGFTINSNGFDPGSVWAARVVANGGTTPANFEKVAVTTFANGLITDGLYNKIYTANCFNSNSLTSAITPILGVTGSDPWVNHNFVFGDVGANGLKGNASNKYLDTGLNPSVTMTANDTAFTLYLYAVGAAATPADMGSQDNTGAGTDMSLFPNDAGTCYWDSYNFTAGQGRCSVAHSGNGYYTGSRTAANSSNIYFASSGSAHASIASIATSGGSFVNFNVFVFDLNIQGTPYAGGWSDDTLSYCSIEHKLTSTDSSNYYNRIQTLRTSLGGGFR